MYLYISLFIIDSNYYFIPCLLSYPFPLTEAKGSKGGCAGDEERSDGNINYLNYKGIILKHLHHKTVA